MTTPTNQRISHFRLRSTAPMRVALLAGTASPTGNCSVSVGPAPGTIPVLTERRTYQPGVETRGSPRSRSCDRHVADEQGHAGAATRQPPEIVSHVDDVEEHALEGRGD